MASDVKANLQLGLQHVRTAKELGADIVLFPELWSHGYQMPFSDAFEDSAAELLFEEKRTIWLNSAMDEDNVFIRAFQAIVSSLEIGVVITYLAKWHTASRNNHKGTVSKKVILQFHGLHNNRKSKKAK